MSVAPGLRLPHGEFAINGGVEKLDLVGGGIIQVLDKPGEWRLRRALPEDHAVGMIWEEKSPNKKAGKS